MKYEKLNKKAKGCMFVATLVNIVIWVAILTVIYSNVRHNMLEEVKKICDIVYIGIVSLSAINLLVSPFVRYKRYKYKITDEEIDVIEGLWFISRTIVPIERLHKITLKRGPIDNMFGLTKVIVTTAGGDAVIRFLEQEKADKIVESLKLKINEIAKNEVN